MKFRPLFLPTIVVGTAAAMIIPAERTEGFTLLGFSLSTGQRDFRIWNNFADATANNNNVEHYNFPDSTGAELAIWKGHIEWQSVPHGDGAGDPTQVGQGLGSGQANFDTTFQHRWTNTGGINDNVVSAISSCSGGTLAFAESPGSNGWRIRFCENILWSDGPGTQGGTYDIQAVACHEYGHALGLGHSGNGGATMFASTGPSNSGPRSINFDDIAGLQAIYGVAANGKPTITDVCVSGGFMTITGTNFSMNNNIAWFTPAGTGNGTPVLASGLSSPSGTELVFQIPAAAGPGDVLVKNATNGNASLSNAWPTDLQDTPGGGCSGPCPAPQNYCQTSPNSVGNGMVMNWSGSQSVADEDFTISAFAGPPGQVGIFYYGENQASVPFGEGIRCVNSGLVGTFRLPIIQLDSFGDVNYDFEWDTTPIGSGPGQILEGTIWNFQFWYRDPSGGPAGFNLSDGLNVEFCP